jgi:2'-phosphotransferase
LSTIDGKLYIRANQGHSIDVKDLELKKITDPSAYPVVVHGTYNAHWPKIKATGLNKMGRNHIHLASGLFGDENVKSGMRATAEVYIYVDIAKAIAGSIMIKFNH